MASVAPKSFYAHLFDEAGVLARVDNALVFFDDNGEDITTIEPRMVNFLTVLGEVGVSETQRIMDVVVHQGFAAVACHRAMEVA